MLDDIEQEDLVELGEVDGELVAVEVPLIVTHLRVVGVVRHVLVHAGDVVRLLCQFPRDIAASAADVDHLGAGAHGVDGHGVGGGEAELHVVGLLDGADVKLAVVEQVPLVEFGAQHRPEYVPGVFHPVDVTDLVAVISGDGELDDGYLRQ